MSRYYTDNPVADADRYFADKEKELESLPACYECGKHITSEYCYEINGEYICEECLNLYHKKSTDDFIE